MALALVDHHSSGGEMQVHHRSKNVEGGRVVSLTHHRRAVPVLTGPFSGHGHEHFFRGSTRISFDQSTPQDIVVLGEHFYENHYSHIIGITEMIRGTAELKRNVTLVMVRFWMMHSIRSRDMKHLSSVLALADDCGFTFEAVLGGESLAALMIESQLGPADTAEGKGQVALLERSLNLPPCLQWLFDERRDVEGHGEQILLGSITNTNGEHTMFVNDAFERHVETRTQLIAERKTMNCSYGWKTIHPGETIHVAGVQLSLQRQITELAAGAAPGSMFTVQRTDLGVMRVWNQKAGGYKEAFVDSYTMAVVVDAVDASKITTYDSISLRFIKPQKTAQSPQQSLLSLTEGSHSTDLCAFESGSSSSSSLLPRPLPNLDLPPWCAGGRSTSEELWAASDIFAEELTLEEHFPSSSDVSLPSRSPVSSFPVVSSNSTCSSSRLQEPGVPTFTSI